MIANRCIFHSNHSLCRSLNVRAVRLKYFGLTEVRIAQESVTKAETKYQDVQEERRTTQQKLRTVQLQIKNIAMEMEKVHRGTDAYLDLVTKENEIFREEKEVLDTLNTMEGTEKQYFTHLSSALRESHEKERARAKRMKYWGIMGSVIGTFGILFGTTVNYLRRKELQTMRDEILESKMKQQSIGTATLKYAALAITVPVAWVISKVFGG